MSYYPKDKCLACGEKFKSTEHTGCFRVECSKGYYVGDNLIYFDIVINNKHYQAWLRDGNGARIYRNDFPHMTIIYDSDVIPEMTYLEWVQLVERIESLSTFS